MIGHTNDKKLAIIVFSLILVLKCHRAKSDLREVFTTPFEVILFELIDSSATRILEPKLGFKVLKP